MSRDLFTTRCGRLAAFASRAAAVMLLVALTGLAAPEASAGNCLSQGEARAAVAAGQAVPLGSIAGSVSGEIVRADLCRQGGRLVYVLSVLTGGRVTNMVIDASTGRMLQ